MLCPPTLHKVGVVGHFKFPISDHSNFPVELALQSRNLNFIIGAIDWAQPPAETINYHCKENYPEDRPHQPLSGYAPPINSFSYQTIAHNQNSAGSQRGQHLPIVTGHFPKIIHNFISFHFDYHNLPRES